MTIANTCVVIAAILPVLTVGSAKFSTARLRRSEGGYDNNEPRSWTNRLDGWKARAVAAQNNGFEALPIFVFAVLAAQQAQLSQERTDHLALAFIALRLVYTAVYLADLAAVRSLVWFAALVASIAIVSPVLGG